MYQVEALMENVGIETAVYPKTFVLKPGENKKVKVAVKAGKKIDIGHHLGKIKFSTVALNTGNNVRVNFKMNILGVVSR